MPLAIPKRFQGKLATFDVGADVVYPDGKGKRLRFFEGVRLDHNANFISGRFRLLGTVALLCGIIYFKSPTRLRCRLPEGVAEELPGDLGDAVRIEWQLPAADAPAVTSPSPAAVNF